MGMATPRAGFTGGHAAEGDKSASVLIPQFEGEGAPRLLGQQIRLGLPQLDQLALASFTTGDAAQFVEHARDLASALASPLPGGAPSPERWPSLHIATSRGGKVARHLLGVDFAGFLTTDRWSAYEWVDAGLRQLCWAHLTRDFQGFIDRGGRGGRIGRELMRERNRFFTWYHRVRDGTLAREHFEERMRGVERRVGQLLREAAVRAEKTCLPSCPTPSPRTAVACVGLRSYPRRLYLNSRSLPELVNGYGL
jgi:hypothetical protein